MKFKMILLLLLAISFNSFARNGGDVSGGGGISESNILYSFYGLGEYLEQAELTSSSSFTKSERNFLSKLKRQTAQESKTKLFFKDSKKYPFNDKAYFTLDITGSEIFINLDKLFIDVNGDKIPYDLTDAIIFNLKIINRGMKDLNSSELEVFYAKIQSALSYEVKTNSLYALGREEIQISIVQGKAAKVLLMDSDKITEFTTFLNETLMCFTASAVKKFINLDNISYKLNPIDESSLTQKITFTGNIQYSCEEDGRVMMLSGSTDINLIYQLSAKESEVIDNSWWENENVSAKLIQEKTIINYRDLVVE